MYGLCLGQGAVCASRWLSLCLPLSPPPWNSPLPFERGAPVMSGLWLPRLAAAAGQGRQEWKDGERGRPDEYSDEGPVTCANFPTSSRGVTLAISYVSACVTRNNASSILCLEMSQGRYAAFDVLNVAKYCSRLNDSVKRTQRLVFSKLAASSSCRLTS